MREQVKVYFDTEFIENYDGDYCTGNYSVKAISCGLLLPEINIEYHYSKPFPENYKSGDQWIDYNVFPKLISGFTNQMNIKVIYPNKEGRRSCEDRINPKLFLSSIAGLYEIKSFLFISDIAGSDSLVLRHFLGGYFEMEKLAPIDTIDLYSIAYSRGILQEVKDYRASLVNEEYIHNALFDAWLVYKIDEKFKLTI